MNEAARRLKKQLDEASFAVDEAVLFLDTHPNDANALAYYQTAAALRRDAMDAYESQVGPLMADSVWCTDRWTWLSDPWPWEGEV